MSTPAEKEAAALRSNPATEWGRFPMIRVPIESSAVQSLFSAKEQTLRGYDWRRLVQHLES